jgi:hypothetical protein
MSISGKPISGFASMDDIGPIPGNSWDFAEKHLAILPATREQINALAGL